MRFVARAALRDHSLLSLVELGHELSVAVDESELARFVLFNLMGHAGTAQSALWLLPEEDSGSLRLVRCHGFARDAISAFGVCMESGLQRWADREAMPARVDGTDDRFDPPAVALAQASRMALIAPILTRNGLIGFVALGERVSGAAYADMDLEVFRTSLGMVGVAFENSRLYHRLRAQNDQLREANTALLELDRLKSEFLQNVNHELRTPITVIIGASECLLEDATAGTQQQRLMFAVSDQARKLQIMVQSLLELSKTASPQDASTRVPLNVSLLLEEYARGHAGSIEEGGRKLLLRNNGPTSLGLGDRDRIIRVIDCLVENAVKFTPTGSRIELSVEDTRDDDREWVRIEVRDNGPGIPPDRIDSVFTPFWQGDGSTTRAAGGLGIGLALAKRMAELMAGRLTVTSHPDQGTAFHLFIPCLACRGTSEGTGEERAAA